MPPSLQHDPIFSPPVEDIQKGEFEEDIGEAAQKVYLKYWEMLKLGT